MRLENYSKDSSKDWAKLKDDLARYMASLDIAFEQIRGELSLHERLGIKLLKTIGVVNNQRLQTIDIINVVSTEMAQLQKGLDDANDELNEYKLGKRRAMLESSATVMPQNIKKKVGPVPFPKSYWEDLETEVSRFMAGLEAKSSRSDARLAMQKRSSASLDKFLGKMEDWDRRLGLTGGDSINELRRKLSNEELNIKLYKMKQNIVRQKMTLEFDISDKLKLELQEGIDKENQAFEARNHLLNYFNDIGINPSKDKVFPHGKEIN